MKDCWMNAVTAAVSNDRAYVEPFGRFRSRTRFSLGCDSSPEKARLQPFHSKVLATDLLEGAVQAKRVGPGYQGKQGVDESQARHFPVAIKEV